MTDTVLYETAGDVAVIRLNRPKALNALTTEMKEGLLAALRRASGEPSGPCSSPVTAGVSVQVRTWLSTRSSWSRARPR